MTARVMTLGVFLSCGLALIALQIVARTQSAWVCDLQTLFSRMMARRATRVAVVLAWAWIGWHFLATRPQ